MRNALLILVAAALSVAAADSHFGLIGVGQFETARLNAFCDGSVVPTPCDITFEFQDAKGNILKQASMILQPETAGFLDFSGRPSTDGGTVEINPCFKVLRGTAQASVEILDNFIQRTRLLINWTNAATPRSGADVDSGMVGITPFETARMTAFCDGSVTPTPCDVAFEFHDAAGRTLKTSRMTLQPDTGGSLDLSFGEAASTARRVEVRPCVTVARGAAVLSVRTIDRFTGITLTHAYPAAPVAVTP